LGYCSVSLLLFRRLSEVNRLKRLLKIVALRSPPIKNNILLAMVASWKTNRGIEQRLNQGKLIQSGLRAIVAAGFWSGRKWVLGPVF
jgi:predicted DNA-binding ArsR family transcriptional regulator